MGTELIILTNKNVDVRNIKKKINTNSNQSLDTFDKNNGLKFENAQIQKVQSIEILNLIKNQHTAEKIIQKKNNLLLGGSSKKRKKRINYNNLAGDEETEDIDIVQMNNINNNDEEWEPDQISDVSD